ncbi:hypothetical protein [Bradyrhizobium ottawaense]|uniref:nSTAND1 domain-containing NTPase n=1 Tax=Bradyrhizobium ottawaense TaxID=931866 RepID=UPI0030B8F07F
MPRFPEEPTIDAPYVGLRPYRESERHLLYGRDDDAARLVNKIFSSQLTLLYAASGVGKTSLLRSVVIPMVRSQEAESLYFDGWTAQDPLLALKQMCAPTAGELDTKTLNGTLEEGIGADSDIVLVLDQFETFLIHHARSLESFKRELGELIRSNSSVHVLISLREEFLAGLSAFRSHIPQIFNSTYRLERLQGEAARSAITKPAETWKKSVSPELVEELLLDLRADSSPDTDPQSALQPEGIEAPFLQLVCRRLWLDAERSHQEVLGIDLYRAAGGKDAIIRSYINEVTSGFRGQQANDAAKILRFLAPPSGVKNSLSVQDVQSLTSLPRDRVEPILNTLTERIVLRARQPVTAHSEVRYELYHDAFTRVLRPWIDSELYYARLKRAAIVSISAISIVGIVGWLVWSQIANSRHLLLQQSQQQEVARARDKAQTDERIAFLRNKGVEAPKYAREVLGSVALYLLDQGRKEDLHRLESLLKQADHDGSISFDHGIDRPAGAADRDKEVDLSPLTIAISEQTFGPERSEAFVAAKQRLLQAWRSSYRSLVRQLGLPVPHHVTIVVDRNLSAGEAKLKMAAPFQRSGDQNDRSRENSRVADIRINEATASAALIRSEDEQRLSSFILERARPSECRPEIPDKAWVYVPRWSLPVWQFRADDRQSLEALMICRAIEVIKEDPTLLLTWPALASIRRHAPAPFDALVPSAKADLQRLGERLIDTLVSQKSAGLSVLLNELSERSAEASAKPSGADQDSSSSSGRSKANVGSAEESGGGLPLDFSESDPFENVEPYFEGSVKQLLSNDLIIRIPEALLQNRAYNEQLTSALEKMRLDWFAKSGLVGPNIQLESVSDTRAVIVQGLADEVVVDEPHRQDRVGAAAAEVLRASKGAPLDSILWELSTLEQDLFDDRNGYYSPLDTARILKRHWDATGGMSLASSRHLEWLVRSLPFWRALEPNPEDSRQIARRLGALSAYKPAEMEPQTADAKLSNLMKEVVTELLDADRRRKRMPREKWRKVLQSLPSETKIRAEQLFTYYYSQRYLPATLCSERRYPLLSAPPERMPELRRNLEARRILEGNEHSIASWDYIACNMEVLSASQNKREASEFFSASLARDELSVLVTDFGKIGRFLKAGVSGSGDIDHAVAVRPLFSKMVPAVAQSSRIDDPSGQMLDLKSILTFCRENSYIESCWDLFIAVAENPAIEPKERFRCATQILYASDDFWTSPAPLSKRATDTIIAMQKDRISLEKPTDEDEAFDYAVAASYRLFNDAMRTGRRADALACIAAYNQIRREHREINFPGKPFASSLLASCLYVAGEIKAARALIDKAHQEAKSLNTGLYDELASIYILFDDVAGLGKVLQKADSKFSDDVFDSDAPYVYAWTLGRLLSAKEELDDVKSFIETKRNLRDTHLAKFVLSWRLHLLNRGQEAKRLLDEYQDENALNEAIKAFGSGRLFKYEDWPELLVRALVAGPSRIDELERYLTTFLEEPNNPLKRLKPMAPFRLADLYFYKALRDTLFVPPEKMESTLRAGLQKVISVNSPRATEFAFAKALLKRSDIIRPLAAGRQKSADAHR